MNYLSVDSLSKSFGAKTLFNNINFGINHGQRIALVAKNGAGKSTLLRIIMGKEFADSGIVTQRKGIELAYLDQHPPFNEEHTVTEALYSTSNPLIETVRKYDEALSAFEKDHSEKNSDRLQEAADSMDKQNAWNHETKIKEILGKLKITFLDRKIKTLSGGQRKRIALAHLLINEPDLLILDEPTNHLDVEMIEWLENYLTGRNLTILLVTHDRYFLDAVCNEIIELDNGKLTTFKGDFQYYMEKKAEQEQIENSEIDKAKNLYRRELEWVRKMPKARGTKSKSRVDAFYDVQDKAFSKKTEDKLQLDVKMTRLGGKILEMIKVSKAYGELPILKSFSYIFKKGERIGVVGKNGVGKTTFLNMCMDLEKPDAGKIQKGETIIFGYYSQSGMKLNDDKRVIEVVKDIADFIPLSDGSKLTASALLTRFLFPPEVQYNFVSKLSGGEKKRLYLLTVLMKNPNFLVLDEPTNDIDLQTLNTLEEFLLNFSGCVLIVTHDRYFMDKMVDHIFVFEGNGIVKDFPGNYTQYREKEAELQKKGKPEEEVKVVETETIKPEKERKQASFKEKFEYEQLEKEIQQLEEEKKTITEKLNSADTTPEEILELSRRIGEVIQQLEEKGMRWLELAELM